MTISSTPTRRRSRFLEDVLTEVIELFPGEYIHVGGDEAVKDRWRDSPRVQARIRELGLADETALQGWFVARIGRFLDGHGRRLIGWDEILESGIPAPREHHVLARNRRRARCRTRGPRRRDGAGADSLSRPPAERLAARASGPPAQSSRSKTSTASSPCPPGLAPPESSHILGAQLNAWTEHMRLDAANRAPGVPARRGTRRSRLVACSARDWPGFQCAARRAVRPLPQARNHVTQTRLSSLARGWQPVPESDSLQR